MSEASSLLSFFSLAPRGRGTARVQREQSEGVSVGNAASARLLSDRSDLAGKNPRQVAPSPGLLKQATLSHEWARMSAKLN